jgi:hypothetical protein
MLTTNDRFTQAQDPTTGVTRACAPATAFSAVEPTVDTVTAPAYLALATIPSSPARMWSELGRKVMTNVDFHDRWPLHSTS